MKKIVFLGCENSHANQFIDYIKGVEKYGDVEIVGVYSEESGAAEKLAEKYGVRVLKSVDELVGKVDGVVITARHGDRHYEYAKPYIASGVPMFVDKPITVSETDAVAFMRDCKEHGVKVTGGSCCKHVDWIQKLRADALSEDDGKTLGGFVRAPVNLNNNYGGFFFYSQHLVEMEGEIFGRYPLAVFATRTQGCVHVLFRYDSFSVTGLFVDGNWTYYASRVSEKKVTGSGFAVTSASECFLAEFDEFYEILSGAPQRISYADFIAPVFVLNAINRSLASGREETVRSFEI